MSSDSQAGTVAGHMHSWLREISVAFVPGPMTPLLEGVRDDLLNQFAIFFD